MKETARPCQVTRRRVSSKAKRKVFHYTGERALYADIPWLCV
jgi:hypothetical protein